MNMPHRFSCAAFLVTGLAAAVGCVRSAQPAAVAAAAAHPAAAALTTTGEPGRRGAAHVVHFAVIGDFGVDGPALQRVAAVVRAMQPEFIATVGDNNYEEGSADTLDANIGKYFGGYIAFDPSYQGPYRAAQPAENRFFPVLGNHDWRAPGAAPYLAYFALPGNERYYTVRRGPVELFAIDSDPHEPDGIEATSVQARWLQAALAQSDAPWKLVLLHHPPFSRGINGSHPAIQWPYGAWGADAVLAGHDHHYERLIIDGLTYIVDGAGGAPLTAVERPAIPEATVDMIVERRYGALLVNASADVLEFRYFDDDGSLLDRHVLEASHRGARGTAVRG